MTLNSDLLAPFTNTYCIFFKWATYPDQLDTVSLPVTHWHRDGKTCIFYPGCCSTIITQQNPIHCKSLLPTYCLSNVQVLPPPTPQKSTPDFSLPHCPLVMLNTSMPMYLTSSTEDPTAVCQLGTSQCL